MNSPVREASFIPRDILPARVDEEGTIIPTLAAPLGVDYINSPVTVSAETFSDGSTSYRAGFGHAALNGLQLHDLLVEIAPHKIRFPQGVIEDWNIVERAERGSTNAKRLQDLHEHLGDAWDDFLPSLPLFLQALRDHNPQFAVSTTIHYPGFFNDYDRSVVRRMVANEVKHGILPKPKVYRPKTFDELCTILANINPNISPDQVLSRLRHMINSDINPQQKPCSTNPSEIKQRAKQKHLRAVLDSTRFSKDRGQILEQHATDADALIDEITATHSQDVEVDGQAYTLWQNVDRAAFVTAMQSPKEKRLGKFTMQAVNLPQIYFSANSPYYMSRRSNFGYAVQPYYVIDGTVRRIEDPDDPVVYIAPQITWTKDATGKRQFTIDGPQQSNEGHRTIHNDSVLGILAVAYLTPEVCAKWPERINIKGSEDEEGQFMGVAQVPVLALFPHSRKALVNSPFIQHAESLVDQPV